MGEHSPLSLPLSCLVQAYCRVGRSPDGKDWVATIVSGTQDVAEVFSYSEKDAWEKASQIVQACNAFPDLVMALEALSDEKKPRAEDYLFARAALRKAKAGGSIDHAAHQ